MRERERARERVQANWLLDTDLPFHSAPVVSLWEVHKAFLLSCDGGNLIISDNTIWSHFITL